MCLELDEGSILAFILQRVERGICWFRITKDAVCNQVKEDL